MIKTISLNAMKFEWLKSSKISLHAQRDGKGKEFQLPVRTKIFSLSLGSL